MYQYGMTQRRFLLELFRNHNYQVSLSTILNTQLAAEYRARFTELRKEGYVITCEKAKKPSDNLYTMVPPEKGGQLRFVA